MVFISVYEDVPKSFEIWASTGHKVFIYSSGSVSAQKLLFEFSTAGNLSKYLSGYFDTVVGPKQEKESYEKICQELSEVVPADIVFLTDIIEGNLFLYFFYFLSISCYCFHCIEAKAAKLAGLNTIVLNRPGNKSFTNEDKEEFNIVEAFTDITFEPVIGHKRKIDAETNDEV